MGTQEPIPDNAALPDGGILCDALEPILVASLPLETCMSLHRQEILRELLGWPRCVRFPLTIFPCLKMLLFQPFTVRPVALHGHLVPFANMPHHPPISPTRALPGEAVWKLIEASSLLHRWRSAAAAAFKLSQLTPKIRVNQVHYVARRREKQWNSTIISLQNVS